MVVELCRMVVPPSMVRMVVLESRMGFPNRYLPKMISAWVRSPCCSGGRKVSAKRVV